MLTTNCSNDEKGEKDLNADTAAVIFIYSCLVFSWSKSSIRSFSTLTTLVMCNENMSCNAFFFGHLCILQNFSRFSLLYDLKHWLPVRSTKKVSQGSGSL